MNKEFRKGYLVQYIGPPRADIANGEICVIQDLISSGTRLMVSTQRSDHMTGVGLDEVQALPAFTNLSAEERKDFIVKIADILYSYPPAYGYFLGNVQLLTKQIEQLKINT